MRRGLLDLIDLDEPLSTQSPSRAVIATRLTISVHLVECLADSCQRIGHDGAQRYSAIGLDPAAQRDLDDADRGFGHHGGGEVVDAAPADLFGASLATDVGAEFV
jgi:hypothetical protein